MKKVALILILCLGFVSLFAQESIKLQNAGNDALRAKDYAKALGNYEKAMSVWGTAPQDSVMFYNCGICAIQVKDYEKAIKYFNLAVTHNFKPEDALFKVALIYKFLKNNDAYLKTINEAIAKYPANANFKGELSKNYLLEGVAHYNSGNALLKEAIDKINAKKFKDANDPGYKAELAKAKKEFSDAIPSFDKAIELNPADTKAQELKAACDKQVKAL
ncbi:MAG: tetratricopeptide repeat protein [Bacteroidetes bacterium]|nr:tetratricopeptide repeat protein [Bacteroidota bacterium]